MTGASDNQLRIVIADDHALLRRGLKQTIESADGLKVVGEAENGRTALAQVEALRPQIAILDVDMPELDGFAAARAIRGLRLGLRSRGVRTPRPGGTADNSPGLQSWDRTG